MKDYLIEFNKKIDKVKKIQVLWWVLKLLFTRWPEIKESQKERMKAGDVKHGYYGKRMLDYSVEAEEELVDFINYNLM